MVLENTHSKSDLARGRRVLPGDMDIRSLTIDPDIVLGGPTGRIKLADESMTFWQSTCRLDLGVRLEADAVRWEGERGYLVDEQDSQYRNG